MFRFAFIVLVICLSIAAKGQSKVDVLHYTYGIDLYDKNDSINGRADILFVVKENTDIVDFDLAGINDGKGMEVTDIFLSVGRSFIQPVFTHRENKLFIQWLHELKKGDTSRAIIYYRGIPGDGLIISKNKYGHRTFFADNWPNRAHYWLVCNDDPVDKASVEFIVHAPSDYKVVSNGILIDKRPLPANRTRTHWKEDIPLPTKVMVIGVADFAVDTAGKVNGVPVETWVFPENKTKGFRDYGQATEVLQFLTDYIGPFPYKKLANVQSKTIFGGMENAGAIFYAESSVTGKRDQESLLAHEIAHQWFGDMATEKSFAHLWLSEGFATYLAHLYIESKYGTDSLEREMMVDRSEVIMFSITSSQPVVDSTSPYMDLLNANSYQKGSWILHMLRRQLGDSIFRQSIRNYYEQYKGKNADTRDLQTVFEKTSGKNLGTFFNQWLYTAGIPQLDITWKYLGKEKKISITVNQMQKTAAYHFPLEILLSTRVDESVKQTLEISNRSETFTFPLPEHPRVFIVDPNISLLFRDTVKELK